MFEHVYDPGPSSDIAPSVASSTDQAHDHGRVRPPTVASVLRMLHEVVTILDPDQLDPATAAALTPELSQIERLAASATVRCAQRAVEGDVWRTAGERSPRHWMATVTADTPTAAGRRLNAAALLSAHTTCSDAYASGELSQTQAELLAPAVHEAPDQADELIDAAKSASVAELRDRCREVRARSKGAGESDHHLEQRRRRRVVRHSTNDGLEALSLAGTTDDIARIAAAIDSFRDAAWADHQQAHPDDEPTAAAIGFDAALLMARHALHDIQPDTDQPDDPESDSVEHDHDRHDEPAPGSAEHDSREPADTGTGHDSSACGTSEHDTPEHDSSEHDTPEHDSSVWRPTGQPAPTPGACEPATPGSDTPAADSATPSTTRRFRKRPPEFTVRIDHAALARGHALPGEICDIPGAGPVPVCVVEQFIAAGERIAVVDVDGEGKVRRVVHRRRRSRSPDAAAQPSPPWWINTTVIVGVRPGDRLRPQAPDAPGPPGQLVDQLVSLLDDRGIEVAELVNDKRKPTAAQRSALRWRDPTCRVQGCTAAARLEVDHHIDWAHEHRTTLSELGRLCHHHHRLRTVHGYTLGTGPGKQPLLSPRPTPRASGD